MATTVEIEVNDRFTQIVADVVRKHFPDIRQHLPKLVGVVRTKMDKDGQTVPGMRPVVAVKKTPPVYAACGVAPYLVVVDAYFWDGAPDHEVHGMIGNALLTLDVQVGTDKKGKDFVRVKNRKPDMVLFTEAVRMFGAFTPSVLHLREITMGVASAALGMVLPEKGTEDALPGEGPPPPQPQQPAAEEGPEEHRPRRAPRRRSSHQLAAPSSSEDEEEERPRVQSATELLDDET